MTQCVVVAAAVRLVQDIVHFLLLSTVLDVTQEEKPFSYSSQSK